ncbi:MAG: hypothetical protein FJ044_01460 [Candidatus Cloacimonetes bacterium]|nr:hypothetical protein [Candidatus Cloacimonadota bacterium]
MKKNRIVLIIFLISLVISLPSIISIFRGNFTPSQIFQQNPFENIVKSLVLKGHPEWKPLEQGLENLIPNTSANVSVSTVYGATKKTQELHISLVTDNKLKTDQIDSVNKFVCNILNQHNAKYDLVVFTALDLKSYSIKEQIQCSN